MKKISKLVSVLFLTGTALLFAGCAKDYSADIKDMNERIDALESGEVGDVSDLQKQIDALKTEINTTNSNIQTIKAALEAKDAELEAGKLDKATYEADKAVLDQALADLQNQLIQKVSELAQKISEAKQDAITQAQSMVSTLSQEIQTKLNALEAAYKEDDQKVIAQLEAELSTLKTELLSEINRVETEYKNADTGIYSSIDNLKTDIENKLTNLEAAIKAGDDAQAVALKAEVQALNTTINAEVAKLQAEYQAGDAELKAEYTAKIENLQNQLDQKVAELTAAIKAGDDAQAAALKAEVQALNTTINAEVAKLQAEYQAGDAELKAEYTAKIENLQNQLDQKVAELNAAIKAGDDAQAAALANKVTELTNKIDNTANTLRTEFAAADAIQYKQITDEYVLLVGQTKQNLDGVDKELQDQINAALAQIANLEGIAKDHRDSLISAFAQIASLKTTLDQDVKELKIEIQSTAKETLNQATEYADVAVATAKEALQKSIESGDIATLKEAQEYSNNNLDAAKSLINTVSEDLNNLENKEDSDVKILQTQINTLNSDLSSLQTTVSENYTLLSAAIESGDKEALEAAKSYADGKISVKADELQGKIDVLTSSLNTLETKVDVNYNTLNNKIDEKVAALDTKVTTALGALEDAYKKGDADNLAAAKLYADGIVANAKADLEASITALDLKVVELSGNLTTLSNTVQTNYNSLSTSISNLTAVVNDNYNKLDAAYQAGDAKALKAAKDYTDIQLKDVSTELHAYAKAYTDAEISRLEDYVDEQDDKNLATLRAELKAKAEELTAAYEADDKAQYERLHAEIVTLEEKVDSLVGVINANIETAKADAIAESVATAAAYTDAKVAALKAEVDATVEKLNAKDAELAKAISDLSNEVYKKIADEVAALKATIETENKKLKDQIDALKSDHDTRIEALEARCAAYDGYFSNIFERLSTAESSISTLTSDVSTLKIDVAALQEDLKTTNEEVANNKKDVDEKISALTLRVADLETWKATTNATLADYESRIKALETYNYETFITEINNLKQRVTDLEDNTIQSLSTLAPKKDAPEVLDYTLNSELIAENMKLDAKFRVKPASQAAELVEHPESLKVYVMTGMSRDYLDENTAYEIDSVKLVKNADGVIEVLAYIPRSSAPYDASDNAYYFALCVNNKKGVPYVMSEYAKAYYSTWELEKHLNWGNDCLSTSYYDYPQDTLDWFTTYTASGKAGKFIVPEGIKTEQAYVRIDAFNQFMTLKEVNSCLGLDLVFTQQITKQTYTNALSENVDPDSSPISFQTYTNCDTVSTYVPIKFAQTSTSGADIRNCMEWTGEISATVGLATKDYTTNATSNLTHKQSVQIKKHYNEAAALNIMTLYNWTYGNPKGLDEVPFLFYIPNSVNGDNFNIAGVTKDQIVNNFSESAKVYDKELGGVLTMTKAEKFADGVRVKLTVKFEPQDFYALGDVMFITNNGHNVTPLYYHAECTGAPMVVYNGKQSEKVDPKFCDATILSEHFVSDLSKTKYYIYKDYTKKDTVNVKNLTLKYSGKAYEGIDYMFGIQGIAEIPEEDMENYRNYLCGVYGTVTATTLDAQCTACYSDGSDYSAFTIPAGALAYSTDYTVTAKKDKIFGDDYSSYTVNTSFTTTKIPFKLVNKYDSYALDAHYEDGLYTVDDAPVKDAFKVVWAEGTTKEGQTYDGDVPMKLSLKAWGEPKPELKDKPATGALTFTKSSGITIEKGEVKEDVYTTWNDYNGRNPFITATLHYGVPDKELEAEDTASISYIAARPIKEVTYYVGDIKRTAGENYSKVISPVDFTDELGYTLTSYIEWTVDGATGNATSNFKPGAAHTLSKTYFVIDWKNRKSTFNGAEYASSADQIYFSVDANKTLYFNMTKDLENGTYVFEVPVQFHYYLNWNNDDENDRDKDFDKKVGEEGCLKITVTTE